MLSLEISWEYGYEFLCIDTDTPPKNKTKFFTNERWKIDGREVEYITIFNRLDSDKSMSKFSLTYVKENNSHLRESDVEWGKTTFSVISPKKVKVIFEAFDQSQNTDVDRSPTCRVMANGIETKDIKRGNVNVILRAEQQALRQNLFNRYGYCCAISKETTTAVLDVAHIIAVKDYGAHTHENAFILRTDLHRLFDAGLLRIKDDGTILISSEIQSKDYMCLDGQPLDGKVFKHIKKALIKKRKLLVGSLDVSI